MSNCGSFDKYEVLEVLFVCKKWTGTTGDIFSTGNTDFLFTCQSEINNAKYSSIVPQSSEGFKKK